MEDPTRTRSSANIRDEMLRGPRGIPRPDELSSGPRLLMNKLKRRGLRLQPEMLV